MSDHLDVLEEQVKAMEKGLADAQAALAPLPELIRKANARIRALRREEQERCQTTS